MRNVKWVAALCAVGLLLGGVSVASAYDLSAVAYEELMPMTSTDITVLSWDYDAGPTPRYNRAMRIEGYYTNDWNSWYTEGNPNPEAVEDNHWMMPLRFATSGYGGPAGDWLRIECDYGSYYSRLGDSGVGGFLQSGSHHYEVRLDRYRGLVEVYVDGTKRDFYNQPGDTNNPQPNGFEPGDTDPEIMPNTFFVDEELVQGEEHEFIGYQHQIDNGWGAYFTSSEMHPEDTPPEVFYGVGGSGEYYLYFDANAGSSVANIRPGILGDANLDGTVDDEDASVLGANWLGTGKVFTDGDFNLDGAVDDKDAAILAANWGKTATITYTPLAPSASVPEPSTWCLLAGALAMLAVWRRKR